MAYLLRTCRGLMKPALWEIVREGSAMLATHACLAAAVKHSLVLGDFLGVALHE